jgi:hypothetical protein
LTGVTLLLLALLLVPQGSDLTDALALGRTHDQATFDAFNAGYELPVSGIVERVELVTEFRRAVLLVRQHAEQGEYSFTARNLAEAMAPYRGTIAIIAVVRLNPLNTFATPPNYDLYVTTGPGSPPIAPPTIDRDAIYPPGISPPGSAMTAVRLTASFPRDAIAAAHDPAIVIADHQGTIIWQGPLDLARYR